MILKLGKKHKRMELYKICINHDPGMTLTYFKARSTLRSPMHLNGGKLLICHLKDKTCSKMAKGRKFHGTPGAILTMPWVYMHAYYHCSPTSLLVYISGLR